LRMDGLRLAGVPGSRCHAKDPRSYPSARLGFWQAQVMSRAGHSVSKNARSEEEMDVVSVHAPKPGAAPLIYPRARALGCY